MTAPPEARRSRRRLAAVVVSEALAPTFIVAALLLLVAWRSSDHPAQALAWGLLAALFASAIPLACVLVGVRLQRLSGRHIPLREQRRQPLLVAVASVAVGALVLAGWGAPRDLVGLTATMAVGLAAACVVTWRWKISIHSAVAAGAVVVVAVVFGAGWLALAPLVALVGWARVATGGHSVAQVLAGTALGAGVATAVFPLLR